MIKINHLNKNSNQQVSSPAASTYVIVPLRQFLSKIPIFCPHFLVHLTLHKSPGLDANLHLDLPAVNEQVDHVARQTETADCPFVPDAPRLYLRNIKMIIAPNNQHFFSSEFTHEPERPN